MKLHTSSSYSNLLANSSNSSSTSDEAAIDAAVAVALQLACHTSSAEQILRVSILSYSLFILIYLIN